MKGLTYQKSIFYIFSLVFFCITLALFWFFYNYNSKVLINEATISMRQTADNINSKLNTFINLMDVVSTQVISNNEVQESLHLAKNMKEIEDNYFEIYPEQTREILLTLTNINSPLIAYGRIGIFDLNKNHVSTGKLGTDDFSFYENFAGQYVGLIDKMNQLDNKKLILPPHLDNWINKTSQKNVISFIREINDVKYSSFAHMGFVEIQQPYSIFEELCSESVSPMYQVIVLDEDKNIIYPYENLTNDIYKNAVFLADNYVSDGEIDYDNDRQLVVQQYSGVTGWTVFVKQESSTYLQPIISLQRGLLLFSVLFYTLSFVLIFLITRSLTLPIRKFRKKIHEVSLENTSLIFTEESNNEISLLNSAFDEMLGKLKSSMEETIAANTRETNAHMLALQAQMNPHFLFNTLMAISGIAIREKNTQIVTICSKLSEMLRYTAAYNQQEITLQNEVTYTKNYLELMKLRYGDFFSYEIDVSQEMLNMAIPKLVLQPLVENSFRHGFSDVEPPYIVTIKSEITPEFEIIHVSDNGCGISEEALKKLMGNIMAQTDSRAMEQEQRIEQTDVATAINFLENSHLGGIGVMNVYHRLKLLWGDALIFNIKNQNGTTITFGKRSE